MPSAPEVRPVFDERKTTQAAAKFLLLAEGRLNYMVLIKLLYLLDRTALAGWGRPVTGDEYFSMKLGPVLSRVKDLIGDMPNPDGPRGYWASHISAPVNYMVTLNRNPGDGALSEAEDGAIRQIFKKYGKYSTFALVDHLHAKLKEWEPVESGCKPLPYSRILKALHKSDAEIKAIEEGIASLGDVERHFAPKGASC